MTDAPGPSPHEPEAAGAGRARGVGRGSARAKVLAAASARFYDRGVAATGIDVITADAGVAKMSLYNNFASKADLVSAYLSQRQQEFLELHRRRREALPTGAGPRARALTVFDAYVDHAESVDGFRGCGLLNVAGELPSGDPNRAAVARHKAEVEELLLDALAPRDGDPAGPDPAAGTTGAALAEHLSLLLEGAMARAGLDGSRERLHHARQMAARLLGEV